MMRLSPRRNSGAYLVEFAIIMTFFLTFVIGAMELARAMYLYNTLEDVTRHAAALAANTDFTDEGAKATLRQSALFRNSPGALMLGNPITDSHLRIDYLAAVRGADNKLTLADIPAATLPGCPTRNRMICLNNPNAPACIRFVRIQVCDPGDSDQCQRVTYQPIVPLVALAMTIPRMTTIVPAETLGYTP
ncbi:MAG TPA: TadE/TadG family type IV pilus assembly protein, partial [Burkholderiaceae bacterium]|nr:TadE/TadG family type IV pilus assembly protein [Burkholderiaceae bacterium]